MKPAYSKCFFILGKTGMIRGNSNARTNPSSHFKTKNHKTYHMINIETVNDIIYNNAVETFTKEDCQVLLTQAEKRTGEYQKNPLVF